MSIKVMTAVFDRYPNGGGEMLLALALADHASDDGSRVFPSVKALSDKTRQSERTVQYQLRRMEEMGWLILVGAGNGGRSMSREYRISIDWIKGAEIAPFKKGAEIAPFEAEKGAIQRIKGCNPAHKRVQPIAPANNHQGIIKESSGGESADAQDGFAPPPVIGLAQSGPEESGAKDFRPRPSMAAAVCVALKSIGMADVNPGNERLRVLLGAGADIGTFVEVGRDCVKNSKPFTYLLATIAGRMADAAALADVAMAAPQAATRHQAAPNKHAGAAAAISNFYAGNASHDDGRTINV